MTPEKRSVKRGEMFYRTHQWEKKKVFGSSAGRKK